MPRKKRKINTERIIAKGSGKEKGLLIAENEAVRATHKKPLLTLEQIESIKESIRAKPRQEEAYTKAIRAGDRIGSFMPTINQMGLALRVRIAWLAGLCSYLNSQQDLAEVITLCIGKEEGSRLFDLKDARKRINSRDPKDKRLTSLVKYVTKDDLTIFGSSPKGLTVTASPKGKHALKAITEQITDLMTDLKATIAATRDFMREEKIKIQAFTEQLKMFEDASRVVTESEKYGLTLQSDLYTLVIKGKKTPPKPGSLSVKIMYEHEPIPSYNELSLSERVYEYTKRYLQGGR